MEQEGRKLSEQSRGLMGLATGFKGTAADYTLLDLDSETEETVEALLPKERATTTKVNPWGFPKLEASFNGQGNVDDFLSYCESRCSLYQLRDEDTVKLSVMNLRGEAAKWWDLIGKKQLGMLVGNKWTEFCKLLRNMYPRFHSRTQVARTLFTRQYVNGSITEYILETLDLYNNWCTDYDENEVIEILKDQLGEKVELICRCRPVRTISELLAVCRELEVTGSVPVKVREENPRKGVGETYPKNQWGREAQSLGGVKCFKCSGLGHYARNCPKNTGDQAKLLVLEQPGTEDNPLEPVIRVLNQYVIAKVDTGSDISVLDYNLASQLEGGGQSKNLETCRKLKTANQEEIVTAGRIEVEIEWQGRTITHEFDVVRKLCCSVILGKDILRRLGAVIDFDANTISLKPLSPRGKVVEEAMTELVTRAPGTDGQRGDLLCVMQSFPNLFRDKPGQTDLLEHRIKVRGTTPVFTPPYRVSMERKALIEEHVRDMLADGIIEPALSPWASPALLVKKKNDKWRFCVDFRKLNAITIRDRFPLPIMSELVQTIGDSRFVSTFDLASGYWQIRLAPEDRDKTAFITSTGQYQFRVLPFGLSSAGASFSAMMYKALRGQLGKTVICYLDDLVVFSEDWDQHIKDITTLFEALDRAGLTLNSEKCALNCETLSFLGLKRTPEGWGMVEEKIEAISGFGVPKTRKNLQSFIGLCNWYSQFIGNFAELAKPLYDCLRGKFRWTENAQNAFEELKKRLVTAPVLGKRKREAPLKLYVDASSVGIGAVLHQCLGMGQEQVLGFASRLLRNAEKNYSTTDRENLALVWGISKFKNFFEGDEVEVVTDHEALKALMTKRELRGRQQRWALYLQEFPIKIVHRKGCEMQAPDALSRYPVEDATIEGNHEQELLAIRLPKGQRALAPWEPCEAVGKEELVREQLADVKWGKVIREIEEHGIDIEGELKGIAKNKNHVLRDGVLCYGRQCPVPIIPAILHPKILVEFHDHPMSGHMGVRRTLKRCRQRMYWPRMRDTIKEYIKSCVTCQKVKATNQPPAGLMQSIQVQTPGDMVGTDLIGPLPTSARGNTYLLVVVDYCTRWVEVFPIRKATSLIIARKLVFEYFARYGFPRAVLSDNGPQFVSTLMSNIYQILKIKRKLTTPYHPQTNMSERINKSLKQMIMSYVGDKHSNWDVGLPFFCLALRTANCETTNQTPAKLFLGRELVLPFDRELNDLWGAAEIPLELWSQVRENTKREQRKQRKYYNRKRKQPQYQVGDLVLLRSHFLSSSADAVTSKFMPRWLGPFQIRNKYSDLTVSLEDTTSGENQGKHHVVNLKPFYQRKSFEKENSDLGTPEPQAQVADEEPEEGEGLIERRRLRRKNRIDYRKAAGYRRNKPRK